MNANVSKPQPVLAVMSFVAALNALSGAAALTEIVNAQGAGILGLVMVAVNAGAAYYLRGQVVPFSNVVEYRPDVDESLTVNGGAPEIRYQ